MITAGELEKQISDMEGFKVRITQRGKDVRSDKGGFDSWEKQRQSKGNMTVGKWIKKFKDSYRHYNIDILKGDGSYAYSTTLLKNVRGSY